LSISALLMNVATRVVVTSTVGASPVTVTSSASPPMPRTNVSVTSWPTLSGTASRACGWNPDSSTFTL
jgi:hypothetical protein